MLGAQRVQKRRSTGCEACRKKKVKCGEERPRCRRCTRHQTGCRYPDPLDVDFRNENDKVAVRAANMWRQRAANVETSNEKSVARPEIDTKCVAHAHAYGDLHSGGLQATALAKFYQDFGCIAHKSKPWMGFFQMLPDLYTNASDATSFSHAILAVSLANLARKQGVPEATILARTEYCKAIKLVDQELRQLDGKPSTNVLVSIILMSLFETLISGSMDDNNTSRMTHIHGAIAMLQQVKPGLSEPVIDGRLLNIIYFHMVIHCLRKRLQPPLPLQMWTSQLDPSLPGPRLFGLMYRLGKAQADIDLVMAQSSSGDNEARERINLLIGAMQMMGQELKEWEASLPPNFIFSIRDITPEDHAMLHWAGAPRTIYSYESFWVSIPRTLCFALQTMLNWNLLEYSKAISKWEPGPGSWPVHCATTRNKIVEMIHHICQSVALMLNIPTNSNEEYEMQQAESIRGLIMMWPLSVASTALNDSEVLEQVGRETATWLTNVLQHARDLIGVA
ncbi:hypothetical protein BGW36DRAFT_371740 [Talaromyces proteolyticus]|uniref:Zn(2)-C6 fungal-type domain-containing protein n=1 Tax=Talaromyces proteolyticus TaxID=1131652 RepID=A0AAD4Q3K3_9EURO|nr:uncharacterized protein BGW36DRAFT_371740 [Talaromyces proteolyticus]KAH8701871.1 hypothetical protein BGW36DRAFT_371740 [Talaromyces proteolyticus]